MPDAKTENSLVGLNQHKIDRLGIGAEVRELKLSGLSTKEIANKLNKTYELTGVNKLNNMTVWRWCKKNNIDEEAPLTKEEAVNVYLETCSMLKDVNDGLELVRYEIDSYRAGINDDNSCASSIKDLALTLEKLLARKQALVTSVRVTQEKIFSYKKITEGLNTIIQMVKDEDLGLYARIRGKIRENKMLNETFRKIKE